MTTSRCRGSRCSCQVSSVPGDRAGVDTSNARRSTRAVKIHFGSDLGTVTGHRKAVALRR